MSYRSLSRTFATLLLAVALMALPAVATAAPASPDASPGLWASTWQGVTDALSTWWGSFWGDDTQSVTAEEELGPWLDPGGVTPSEPLDVGTTDTQATDGSDDDQKLGPWLDPGG